jgi:hypothetical protein
MSGKIAFLSEIVSPHALLAQIAEREGLEGFVAIVRVNDSWYSCWSTGFDHGSLCMAAVKLLADVQANMYGEEMRWSPPEKDSA